MLEFPGRTISGRWLTGSRPEFTPSMSISESCTGITGPEKVTGFLSQEKLGRPCSSNLVVEEIEHNPAMCAHQCRLESGVGEHARREVVTYFRHRAGHLVWVRLWTMAVKNRVGDIVSGVGRVVCAEPGGHAEVERRAAKVCAADHGL
jgi:hypothetical protein